MSLRAILRGAARPELVEGWAAQSKDGEAISSSQHRCDWNGKSWFSQALFFNANGAKGANYANIRGGGPVQAMPYEKDIRVDLYRDEAACSVHEGPSDLRNQSGLPDFHELPAPCRRHR